MKGKIINRITLSGILVCLIVSTSLVYSHCQIPCGIYDDGTRFTLIAEHIATVEKSIKQITELSGQGEKNYNQIVRWVQNKENHADYIMEIVADYFMAQRIKPADKINGGEYEKYVKKLTLLHEMLVYSMKAKQTTDLSNVEKLKTLLGEFKTIYFENSEHQH